MNGYLEHSGRFMEAFAVQRDLRHTRNGGWRLAWPRDAVAPGLDPSLPALPGLGEAELTAKRRKGLDSDQFAIPEKRAYPINDENHARNALARVAQNGSPEEQKRVLAAVKRKFPDIDTSGSKGRK